MIAHRLEILACYNLLDIAQLLHSSVKKSVFGALTLLLLVRIKKVPQM